MAYLGVGLKFRFKDRPKLTQKSTFDVDDVTDDVTAWRQNVRSILMFKWNCHIFRDTGRSVSPIITKLGLHM